MPHALTLVSAALYVFAFPPWDFDGLAWFALVPWLLAIRRAPSWRDALVQGVWLSVLVNLGGFYWVAFVLREFGGLPWPLAIIGWFLFSFICQPQFYLLAPVLRWTGLLREETPFRPWRAAGLALLTALVYAGTDRVLPKLFVDTLGHAMYAAPLLRQAADIGGAPLLTTLLFLANDTLAFAIARFRKRQEPSIWPALHSVAPSSVLLLAALGLTLLYGSRRGAEIARLTEKAPAFVQAAAIQGNIGDFDKLAAERGVRGAAEKVLSTYLGMSDQATLLEQKPDLLVWPETAYPSTFRTPNNSDELFRDQKVEAFVSGHDIPLLFGGYDHWQRKDFNALFALSPRTEPGLSGNADLQTYRKNVLLLFGEYIPGAEQLKFIRDQFPQVGNFGRGVGPDVVSVAIPRIGSLKASPVICYEALFPDYVIAAARKGSQLILNITNDSWFGPWGEPYLHLALVAFRSVETRLPQLRATNTGISALVLPNGDITNRTPINEPAIMNVRIPLIGPVPTLMKSWGDWYGYFAALAGWAGVLALYARRNGSRK